MIDKVTANLYDCCKSGYRWTNYNAVEKNEGPIPPACPKCKNVRWNQKYTSEELTLFEELAKQHIVPDPMPINFGKFEDCNLDFVAQDFLFGIRPQNCYKSMHVRYCGEKI
jgi:hypothetical protein